MRKGALDLEVFNVLGSLFSDQLEAEVGAWTAFLWAGEPLTSASE